MLLPLSALRLERESESGSVMDLGSLGPLGSSRPFISLEKLFFFLGFGFRCFAPGDLAKGETAI